MKNIEWAIATEKLSKKWVSEVGKTCTECKEFKFFYEDNWDFRLKGNWVYPESFCRDCGLKLRGKNTTEYNKRPGSREKNRANQRAYYHRQQQEDGSGDRSLKEIKRD